MNKNLKNVKRNKKEEKKEKEVKETTTHIIKQTAILHLVNRRISIFKPVIIPANYNEWVNSIRRLVSNVKTVTIPMSKS